MSVALVSTHCSPISDLEPLCADSLPIGVAAGTDLASAHLLREHHGDDLMFCPELGWLDWDGRRFVANGTHGPSRRAQNIGRRLELGAAELQRDAARLENEGDRKKLKAQAESIAKWARYAQSAVGIRRALEIAETLLRVSPDQLDADPMLLNVANGTVELTTGTLREHRREDRITQLAPVAYDPSARAPRWEKFLQEILPDTDVRDFMVRYLGYACTAFVSEHAFVIGLGSGANGKSVLCEIVRAVLGEYARDLPTDALMHSKHGSHGPGNELARLKASRFVTCQETEQDRRLDEPRVKGLTGSDTITARFLYKEFFEFRPTFKIVISCNHRPMIRGIDAGIWRRINLVPFAITIPPEQRDPALTDKLWAEASGILAALVRGCLEWQQIGLRPPPAVASATAQWREESDNVAMFIAAACIVGAPYSATASDLYATYTHWMKAEGGESPPISKRAFGERLAALGYEEGRSGTRGRYWKGLGLPAPPDPSADDSHDAGLKGWVS